MKGGHNKKSVRVEFVMSEAEAELVKERMAELGITNLSAYLRKMAVDGYIIHLDMGDIQEMIRLLRICSNNLNQYTRRANETGSIYAADIEDIRTRLDSLWDGMDTNILLHILNNNEGVKAVDFIKQDVLIQNDKQRMDGKTDYINCSVQYPNWWYLRRVKDNNPIFSDWAILFIDPIVATIETTQFCKVNAATRYGAYICKGAEAFRELFSANVGRQNRTKDMLQNAPTDDQAEVLVYENIPVSMIKGIAFENEEIARQKIVEWKVMGFPKIDVFISPELFDVSTSGKIRRGEEPLVKPYREEENELF